jgi:hypothetical protein
MRWSGGLVDLIPPSCREGPPLVGGGGSLQAKPPPARCATSPEMGEDETLQKIIRVDVYFQFQTAFRFDVLQPLAQKPLNIYIAFGLHQ